MELLVADHKEIFFAAGLGFGKSTSASLYIINQSIKQPHLPMLIVSATYGQLKSALLTNLHYWCDFFNIYYHFNTSTKFVHVGKAKHFCRSGENAIASRGLEASDLIMDEACYVTQEAADVFIGRIRYPGANHKKIFLSTTRGFNWLYHRFHPSGEQFNPKRLLIQARTIDNYFLPSDYEHNLRTTYNSKLALQELDAEFLSLQGLACYYEFDRKKHTKPLHKLFTDSPSQQLYVFMDINIDPMAGVVGFVENHKLHVIDEIFIEGGTDIPSLANHIKSRYGIYNPIICFDGTGGNKRNVFNIKQTANKTMESLGLRTMKMHNPLVVKRLAHANNLIYHNKVIIDSNKCPFLIRDLEQVQYGKDSNDIDKTTNKMLTHVSDGFSYMCWKLLEAQKKQSRSYSL